MSDTVLTDNDGPLRTIILNRPDKLNAFTAEMHLAFRAALEAARDDDSCRAVLLTGAGPTRRGRLQLPPASGIRPILAKACRNLAPRPVFFLVRWRAARLGSG